MRTILVGFLLIGAAGCGALLTAPRGDTALVAPDTAVLAIGDEVTVDGALAVRIVEIPHDSRCPVDVTCVWAGNAEVVLSTTAGGVERVFTLNTLEHSALGPRSVEVGGYRLTLLRLRPRPRSDVAIAPEDYRIMLEITQS